MKLSDFDFNLPKELIAQAPASPRDHARLLVYSRQSGQIIDDYFFNLQNYLPKQTTLVLNNSKVEKARLRFGNIEILVVEILNSDTVRAMVRPGRKFNVGQRLELAKDLQAQVMAIDDQGLRTLKLKPGITHTAWDKHRLTPFPPYIAQDEKLSGQYQTVYAKALGSKAAPTAGLHFTERQLKQIKKRWPVVELTLHVGLGTFAPVKHEDISQHKMHSEQFILSDKAATILNKSKHITAVGTTSVRVLECLPRPYEATTGSTIIFIKPGYKFHATDALITNFHLPKSTLLMLVSAFVESVDEMYRVYKHAIDNKYRFYSFGDAMLIL